MPGAVVVDPQPSPCADGRSIVQLATYQDAWVGGYPTTGIDMSSRRHAVLRPLYRARNRYAETPSSGFRRRPVARPTAQLHCLPCQASARSRLSGKRGIYRSPYPPKRSCRRIRHPQPESDRAPRNPAYRLMKIHASFPEEVIHEYGIDCRSLRFRFHIRRLHREIVAVEEAESMLVAPGEPH